MSCHLPHGPFPHGVGAGAPPSERVTAFHPLAQAVENLRVSECRARVSEYTRSGQATENINTRPCRASERVFYNLWEGFRIGCNYSLIQSDRKMYGNGLASLAYPLKDQKHSISEELILSGFTRSAPTRRGARPPTRADQGTRDSMLLPAWGQRQPGRPNVGAHGGPGAPKAARQPLCRAPQ